MKLPRIGRGRRGIDGLAALLVLAAVAVYAARAARRPEAPEPPFGTPLPAALTQRLEALGAGRALGDESAPVRLVELADYQCPACAIAHDSIWPWAEALVRAGRLHYTAYHFPLPIHPAAVPAATVLECAAHDATADAFWTLRSELLRRQAEWAPPGDSVRAADALPDLLLIAERSGADTARTRECLTRRGDTLRRDLAAASSAAQEAGLTFTPVYAVDGEIVFWGEVRQRVEDLLRAR